MQRSGLLLVCILAAVAVWAPAGVSAISESSFPYPICNGTAKITDLTSYNAWVNCTVIRAPYWDRSGKYAALIIQDLGTEFDNVFHGVFTFPALTRIEGTLKVYDNPTLTKVKLPQLSYIGATLHVENNVELGNNGNGHEDEWIQFAPFTGPGSLHIGDSIIIDKSKYVESLMPIRGYTGEVWTLVIAGTGLTTLNGLNITRVKDTMIFTSNSQLGDMSALSIVDRVGGTMYVGEQNALQTLRMDSLVSVGNRITLYRNTGLSLIQFPRLVQIGDVDPDWADYTRNWLLINYSPLIANLDGFSALRNLNGRLTLELDGNLTSINGLNNVVQPLDSIIIDQTVKLRDAAWLYNQNYSSFANISNIPRVQIPLVCDTFAAAYNNPNSSCTQFQAAYGSAMTTHTRNMCAKANNAYSSICNINGCIDTLFEICPQTERFRNCTIGSYDCNCVDAGRCSFTFDRGACTNNPCKNGAECQNFITRYQCLCPLGYTDQNCTTIINNCLPKPCRPDQQCISLIGDYACIDPFTRLRVTTPDGDIKVSRLGGFVPLSGERFGPDARVYVKYGAAGPLSSQYRAATYNISYADKARTKLVFYAPASNSTSKQGFYVPMTVVNPIPNVTNIDVSVDFDTKGLYVFNVDCPGGQFQNSDEQCVPCPSGGFCPGGDRVYPIPGYWSPNENTPPTECNLFEACPGALGTEEYPIQTEPAPSFKRITAVCAVNIGYTGDYCAECTTSYYKQANTCQPCAGGDADRIQFIIYGVTALVVLVVMAIGVAVLTDRWLTLATVSLIALQQCISVGTIAAAHLGVQSALDFFGNLSVLNFQIDFFKAGCVIPRITFVSVFWATVVMMLIAAVLFVTASFIRAKCLPQTFLRERNISWKKAFKRRTIYSLVVLANIIYLQLVTRLLQGVRCVKNGVGTSVLSVELTTQCYTGAHLGTSIFIWPVLFGYGIAFPVWCFYITRRSAQKGMDDLKRAEKYGYLYRDLHKRFYYFRIFNFATNFAIALQTALNSPVAVSIFVSLLFLVINVVLVGTFWPFKTQLNNFSWFASGMGTVLQGLILLGFVQANSTNADDTNQQTRQTRLTYFYLGLFTTIVSLLWVIFINARRKFCAQWGAAFFLYCEPGDPYHQHGGKSSVGGLEQNELKELSAAQKELDESGTGAASERVGAALDADKPKALPDHVVRGSVNTPLDPVASGDQKDGGIQIDEPASGAAAGAGVEMTSITVTVSAPASASAADVAAADEKALHSPPVSPPAAAGGSDDSGGERTRENSGDRLRVAGTAGSSSNTSANPTPSSSVRLLSGGSASEPASSPTAASHEVGAGVIVPSPSLAAAEGSGAAMPSLALAAAAAVPPSPSPELEADAASAVTGAADADMAPPSPDMTSAPPPPPPPADE